MCARVQHRHDYRRNTYRLAETFRRPACFCEGKCREKAWKQSRSRKTHGRQWVRVFIYANKTQNTYLIRTRLLCVLRVHALERL